MLAGFYFLQGECKKNQERTFWEVWRGDIKGQPQGDKQRSPSEKQSFRAGKLNASSITGGSKPFGACNG
ncbi:MAG TPA: hypothetical protein DCZ94_09885 [Lentisphaeria bacterium]|nr:hypothetical protein [Lentisphaeria bacterium]